MLIVTVAAIQLHYQPPNNIVNKLQIDTAVTRQRLYTVQGTDLNTQLSTRLFVGHLEQ